MLDRDWRDNGLYVDLAEYIMFSQDKSLMGVNKKMDELGLEFFFEFLPFFVFLPLLLFLFI